MQLNTRIIETGISPQASIIWLHGLGADGSDFVPMVEQLPIAKKMPLRFIFPDAPEQPITLNNGFVMRAWYDIYHLKFGSREDAAGLQASARAINHLIDHEIQVTKIASEKIILAGFSQGGALALQCGLRYPQRLGGILALSTYLPLASTLEQEASPANKTIPILLAHGSEDAIIPLAWSEWTREVLSTMNYSVKFLQYPMAHSVCAKEILDISVQLQTWFNSSCFT